MYDDPKKLFANYRESLNPDAKQLDRTWKGVQHGIAAGVGAATVAGLSGTASAAATKGTATAAGVKALLSAKVIGVVAATLTVGGVAGYKYLQEPSDEPSEQLAIAVPAEELIHPAPKQAESVVAQVEEVEAPQVPEEPLQAPAEEAVPEKKAKPKTNVRDSSARKPSLAEELRYLQRAKSAMERGQYSTALKALSKHQRIFSNGALADEREVLRAELWCQKGSSQKAKRLVKAFLAKNPESHLRLRAQQICVK